MQQTLTLLSPPRNQTCKILKALIEGKILTEQMTSMNGFRTRISELKRLHQVPIHFAWKKFTSEFGEESQCKAHFILEVDRERCCEIYEKINK
jgi:hypothetical protein